MKNSSPLFRTWPIWRILTVSTLASLLWVAGPLLESSAHSAEIDQNPPASLKQLSLEQLGNVEVTTASKEPEQVWRTPAAINVITQEDIRRSGATSIPEILRLAPGLEVARTDSDHWVQWGCAGLGANSRSRSSS